MLRGTDIFVEQLWTLDADKVHIETLGNGSSQVCLAATRRAIEEKPLTDSLTLEEHGVFLGNSKDLLNFLLRVFQSTDLGFSVRGHLSDVAF